MSSFFKLLTILIPLIVVSLVNATDRDTDTAVFDIDASGEVDALTDGLLILRSMFGLSDFSFYDLYFVTKYYLIFFMVVGRIELLTLLIICKKFLFKN